MSGNENLYSRQQQLNLDVPNSAVIIGIGGIGSWVALDLALIGIKKLVLIDFDKIEEHNLNRTPFTQSQRGILKIEAISQLIYERRPFIEITSFEGRIHDAIKNRFIRSGLDSADIIIDCTDTKDPPIEIRKKIFAALGYDGYKITIHLNPSYDDKIWGDGPTGYRTIPSYLVPPQLLACIVTHLVLNRKKHKKEQIITFDTRNILDAIIMFQKNQK